MAYSGLIQMQQSDGTFLNVYLYGDENFSYMTTEDGYLLQYNDLGGIEYARIAEDKIIVPIGVLAHNEPNRTSAEVEFLREKAKFTNFNNTLKDIYREEKLKRNNAQAYDYGHSNEGFPLVGSPKSLVILVNFSNVKFTSPTANEDFTRMLNQYNYSDNEATGSARDYFRTSSFGVFDPEFIVVGPYDLPETMAHYGQQDGNVQDKRPGNMIVDACNAADNDIDFTDFDINKDGYIDNVFVYYAGYNQAEGAGVNTIWPHRSVILNDIKYDGVRVYDYACTSEFRANKGGVMCGIGTFCHEFGHVLSLPDLYDTEYSGHKTLGKWDIMDQGSYNNNGRTPPTYSAYERFYLGWLTPKQLKTGVYNLEPLSISNTAYLVAVGEHNLEGKTPEASEFFMIENRRNEFEQDGVPANGMLVTHIDYSKRNWRNNVVNNDPDDMGVEIVCASGTTAQPHQNVFPGSLKKTFLSLSLDDGTFIDTISSIVSHDSIISFSFGSPLFIPEFSIENDLEIFEVTFGETQAQSLSIKGSGVVNGIVRLKLDKALHFALRVSDDDNATSVNELTFEPDEDGNVNIKVDIEFNPKEYSILNYLSDNLSISTEYSNMNISLRGRSNKPVLVVPPLACDAKNISPYTFDAVWSEVHDATAYYLSVYSLDGGDTLFIKNNECLLLDSLKSGMCYRIIDLDPATDYRYRVRASDKDPYGRYENITDYSNEIQVTTLYGFGAESRKLDVLKQGDVYVAYLPAIDAEHSIFIYSIDGKFISSVPVLSNAVLIPELERNKIYLLKYASNDGLKRKSKVIKLYYE